MHSSIRAHAVHAVHATHMSSAGICVCVSLDVSLARPHIYVSLAPVCLLSRSVALRVCLYLPRSLLRSLYRPRTHVRLQLLNGAPAERKVRSRLALPGTTTTTTSAAAGAA